MGFGKAFGFSILAFIGLNFAFFLLAYGIEGVLMTYFASISVYPSNTLAMFLGPIVSAQFPLIMTSQLTAWVTGTFPVVAGDIILFIGYIVAPIIAAFLSGRFGENKVQAFFGWFTTVMICAAVVAIWGSIEIAMLGAPLFVILAQILGSISIGLVYAFACGSISLLTMRE